MLLESACTSERTLRRDFLAGLEHQKAGRLYDAAQIWAQIIQNRPSMVGPRTNFAILEYQRGRRSSAIRLLKQELAINNTVFATRYAQAVIAYRSKDILNAARVAKSLAASYPKSVSAALLLAQIEYETETPLDSYKQHLQLAMSDQSSAETRAYGHNLHGLALYRTGLYSKAADAFGTAAELRNDAIARYNQAVALATAGRFSDAAAPLKQAAALDPDAYQIPLLQARLEIHNENFVAAARLVVHAEQLAKDTSTNFDAIAGHIALEQHQYPEAMGALQSAVKRNPDMPALWTNLAIAAIHTDRPQIALNALRTAHKIAPQQMLQDAIKKLEAVLQ